APKVRSCAEFSRVKLERAKGFEPSTPTLARSCSTPELHPRPKSGRANGRPDERAPMPKGRNLCNHPARGFIRAPCPLVARSPALNEARAASRISALHRAATLATLAECSPRSIRVRHQTGAGDRVNSLIADYATGWRR